MMASFILEDLTGTIEVLVFPRIFAQSSGLKDDQIIVIEGKYNIRDDERKLFAERITGLEQASEHKQENASRQQTPVPRQKGSIPARKLYLRFPHEGTTLLGEVIPVLKSYAGPNPVFFYFVQDKKLIQGNREFWVKDLEELVQDLSKILGNENVAWKVS
jgi:DNA polymerase-3 subunit alpha